MQFQTLITKAHSFPRPAEFRAKPRNLGFGRGIEPRNFTVEFVLLPWNAAEFDVFLSNNYFFTENDLKNSMLPPCELSSYRPISNLSFLSKLLERVISVQLTGYLLSAGLLPVHQSA